MNGNTLSISADGSLPTISPPAGSTAAFVIANAGVSVSGASGGWITVSPTSALTYGAVARYSWYASAHCVAVLLVATAAAGSARRCRASH